MFEGGAVARDRRLRLWLSRKFARCRLEDVGPRGHEAQAAAFMHASAVSTMSVRANTAARFAEASPSATEPAGISP